MSALVLALFVTNARCRTLVTDDLASTISARARSEGVIDAADFGMSCNGVSNDQPHLAEAVQYALLHEIKNVLVPSGSCMLSAEITIPGNVVIVGAGQNSTIFRPAGHLHSLVTLIGGYSGISLATFENVDSLAETAITVQKPRDNLPLLIEAVAVIQFKTAISVIAGDNLVISRSFFNSNSANIVFSGQVLNSLVSDNYILGGNGIDFQSTSTQAEGITISNNTILPSVGGTFALRIEAGYEIHVVSNVFDQTVDGSGVVLDARRSAVALVKLESNYIGARSGSPGSRDGLEIIGGVTGVDVIGNTFSGWKNDDVSMQGGDIILTNNAFNSTDGVTNVGLLDALPVTMWGNTMKNKKSSVIELGRTRSKAIGNNFYGPTFTAANSLYFANEKAMTCELAEKELPNAVYIGTRGEVRDCQLTLSSGGSSAIVFASDNKEVASLNSTAFRLSVGQAEKIRFVKVLGDVAVSEKDRHLCIEKITAEHSDVTLTGHPAVGTLITVDDCKGDAKKNNIKIIPEDGTIDDSPTFTIKTDFGSWTGIYTGTFWKTESSR